MPNPALALAGVSAGSGIISARAQSRAASQASEAQVKAAKLGIDEQRRQFNKVQQLLSPFVQGGTDAFRGALALSGALGAEQEREAIDQITAGPQFQEGLRQGQESILATASATGGLRGGNTQAALQEFAPSLLNNIISQRFGQLGGLGQLGQASAAGVGSAGMQLGSNVSGALGQIGASQAGAALARGQAVQSGLSGITRGIGSALGSMDMSIPEGETIFSKWGF